MRHLKDAAALAKETPVMILCGGLGTRLKEETEFRPKPMVPIGERPILWHIMHLYSRFGFRRFILCVGFKGEVIKDYFLRYAERNQDFTTHLKSRDVTVHAAKEIEDWEVTVVDTGQDHMTGSRVSQGARRFLNNASHMALSYGDGLTDANLLHEFAFHLEKGRLGTVLGVNPPSRFGELRVEQDQVSQFDEKPVFTDNWINGGFFFFRREFFERYLTSDSGCILEQEPLRHLAEDGELSVFKHPGFWACMDTQRDRDHLNALWNGGTPPWKSPDPLSTSCSNHLLQEISQACASLSQGIKVT